MLERNAATVTAHIDGLCASAATIVACHADKVVAAADGSYMVHPVSMGVCDYLTAEDMQSTGPNGEDGAASTLYKVFEAISKQDKYQQTATIKTLFGQWAIEGVSKNCGQLACIPECLAYGW